MEIKKFGIRDQIGYVCGGVADSFISLYVDALFLIFCTYILRIKAAWMRTLSLLARFWDTFNGPIISSLPDRWQIGKSGDKPKPHTRVAMIPLAVSGLLRFTDVSSFGSVARHVWVAAAYIFYGMLYTGTSIPYGLMALVTTNGPIERAKLFKTRSIGGTIVRIDGLSLMSQLIFNEASGAVPNGFIRAAIAFGALLLLSYILLLRLVTEHVGQPKVEGQKFSYDRVLGSMIKSRPMSGIMLATVGSFLYITDDSQLRSSLYKEYYHTPQVLTLASLVNMSIILIFFPIIPRLSQKFGKRNVILFCPSYSPTTSAILLLIPIPSVHLFLILNTPTVSRRTAFTVLIWAFVTDCIDYSKHQTGEKGDGSICSTYTFSRKIGSTLTSTVTSFSLGVIGYISGVETQVETMAHSIRYLCTDTPVVACILELIGIDVVYSLTKEKTNEMYAELSRRRDVESRTQASEVVEKHRRCE